MNLATEFPTDLWGSRARARARSEATMQRNAADKKAAAKACARDNDRSWVCRAFVHVVGSRGKYASEQCDAVNGGKRTWCHECGSDKPGA